MFAFGLAFQIPVALTLLARAGLVNSQQLKKRRKYAIVVAFIVAAILTPPDLISQIGLGIPIIILFEIVVGSFSAAILTDELIGWREILGSSFIILAGLTEIIFAAKSDGIEDYN